MLNGRVFWLQVCSRWWACGVAERCHGVHQRGKAQRIQRGIPQCLLTRRSTGTLSLIFLPFIPCTILAPSKVLSTQHLNSGRIIQSGVRIILAVPPQKILVPRETHRSTHGVSQVKCILQWHHMMHACTERLHIMIPCIQQLVPKALKAELACD